MFTIDNLHRNTTGVIQVSPLEQFEDLGATIAAMEAQLKSGSRVEQNMLSYFQREVVPEVAYRDNDVNQGESGPRRLFVIGNLLRTHDDNLFVRLGILTPDENPLIPTLQVLYLSADGNMNQHLRCISDVPVHVRYLLHAPTGLKRDPDRWAYDFTERYSGMVTGVHVRTRAGIKSLALIPKINEAILTGV